MSAPPCAVPSECLKSVAWHIRVVDCLCSSNTENLVEKGRNRKYFYVLRWLPSPYSVEWFMVKKFRSPRQSNKFIVPFSVFGFTLRCMWFIPQSGAVAIYIKIFFIHLIPTSIRIHNSFIWFFCDWLNLRDIAIGFIVLDALVVAFIIHNLCVLFRLQMVFWQSETGIWWHKKNFTLVLYFVTKLYFH